MCELRGDAVPAPASLVLDVFRGPEGTAGVKSCQGRTWWKRFWTRKADSKTGYGGFSLGEFREILSSKWKEVALDRKPGFQQARRKALCLGPVLPDVKILKYLWACSLPARSPLRSQPTPVPPPSRAPFSEGSSVALNGGRDGKR